mmetsp:Transcript_22240/g.39692  ORF Transcript_22240/g.39692 Transcript_22240/m.39692 type:complete len:92 (-) Transcript_22240:179-454(-)
MKARFVSATVGTLVEAITAAAAVTETLRRSVTGAVLIRRRADLLGATKEARGRETEVALALTRLGRAAEAAVLLAAAAAAIVDDMAYVVLR